ncbi:MAG: hypothetical protein J3Q66DRAFT_92025 [Benniella sp.]|nr:MAG: hypothetical protein J3Q66DRAFT_92025 [Benniella sp.]
MMSPFEPTLPSPRGSEFANKARELSDRPSDSPELHCIGTLFLLAFKQMSTGNGYGAWMYVDIAIRMAQHLGLNRSRLKLNPSFPKEPSFAYDNHQIVGYQGTDTRHAKPSEPTPYFSPIVNHHHRPQTPVKPLPGLTQGHTPCPITTPGHVPGRILLPHSVQPVSSIPNSLSGPTVASGSFPSLQDVGVTTSNVCCTTLNANALIDPFFCTWFFTVAGSDSTQQLLQQQSQASIESVQQEQQPLNLYQNLFSEQRSLCWIVH